MRAGALGDVLLLRLAVAALSGAGARVALLAPEASGRALVGPGPSEIDSLIPWDRADVAGLMADAADVSPLLRRDLAAFDLAIAYTRDEALLQGLRGLVRSVVAWDPRPPPEGPHAARWLAEPVARLHVDVGQDPQPCAPLDEERRAVADLAARLPEGFLAVHPGSGSTAKNWPASSFAALVTRLAGDRPWLLVEGPADAAACAPLRGRPGAVLAGELPARQLGALLCRSGLYVGNDSGISHLAAAFGAPVVALFGPTDPAVWRPIGPGVRALRAPTGRMEDLGVEEVSAACLALAPRLKSAAARLRGC